VGEPLSRSAMRRPPMRPPRWPDGPADATTVTDDARTSPSKRFTWVTRADAWATPLPPLVEALAAMPRPARLASPVAVSWRWTPRASFLAYAVAVAVAGWALGATAALGGPIAAAAPAAARAIRGRVRPGFTASSKHIVAGTPLWLAIQLD